MKEQFEEIDKVKVTVSQTNIREVSPSNRWRKKKIFTKKPLMLSLVWFSLLNVSSNTRSFNSFLQIIDLHFHWAQTRVQRSISNLSSKTETRQWNWKWQQRNEKCRKVEKRQCPELDSGEAMKMKKRRFVSSVEVENDRQTEDHIFLSFVWSQLHQSKELSIHFLFLNNDLFTSAYSFPIKITSHSKWQNLLSTLILINWKENCRLSSSLWPLSLSNFRCFSHFLSWKSKWKSRELFIEFNSSTSNLLTLSNEQYSSNAYLHLFLYFIDQIICFSI